MPFMMLLTPTRTNTLLVLAALMLVSIAIAAGETPRVLYFDNFSEKLDKDWAWVREEPKAWKLENNALLLRTQPGYIHGRENNAKNILVRPMPAGGGGTVAIEVSVENDPKIQFEHAGLLWYFDDDNYVGIYKESLGGKPEIQMIAERDAKPTGAVKASEGKKVWLRLVVSEGKVTGQFRESEKEEWKTVGEKPAPMTGAGKAGIIAGGAPKDADHVATFREFRIVQLTK
jgi:regulation of enolase protein 1 (concanavalin A-like superfamily)